MWPKSRPHFAWWALAALLIAVPALSAHGAPAPTPPPPPPTPAAAPAATPAPAPPPSPVSGIRGKLSAGDFLSAESVLEVFKEHNGENGAYLAGLSWLARGALLLGDTAQAGRLASDVRRRCADQVTHGADPAKDHDLETALGAALEVQTQLLERAQGPGPAAEFLRGELAGVKGPVALRARLNKRINLLTLAGSPAPELAIEDFLGPRPPALADLKGKPVVLFLWAEWCSDCKAQAAGLARVKARHTADGLQVVAVTRYYDEEAQRAAEKARVDSVWKAVYADVGAIPVVISTASMERYGGSSTPTFVFVDRAGIVRWYTPTRLTDEEFERALGLILH